MVEKNTSYTCKKVNAENILYEFFQNDKILDVKSRTIFKDSQ